MHIYIYIYTHTCINYIYIYTYIYIYIYNRTSDRRRVPEEGPLKPHAMPPGVRQGARMP